MMFKDHLRHFFDAARYSGQGLAAAWGETAFRQEVYLLTAALPSAFWLGRNVYEIIMLIGSLWLVLIVELLNSAVEAAIDRIGDEPHPLSGRAKDLGSAAVLLCLILAGGIWLTILLLRLAS